MECIDFNSAKGRVGRGSFTWPLESIYVMMGLSISLELRFAILYGRLANTDIFFINDWVLINHSCAIDSMLGLGDDL